MPKVYRLFLLLTFTVSFSALLYAREKKLSGRKEIIILHVNDMHSKIDNMAKLAYLADSLRKYHPYVFLVSAGDNFTGNPVVDQIPDKGFPMIELMNRCGFSLSAFGNHEFDMGQEMLNKRIHQSAFRFICANFDASGAVVKQPQPYFIFNAGEDTRIAFLGLLQLDKNGKPSAHPANLAGIKFSDGIGKAGEFTFLKEQNNVMIALSHLGVHDDTLLARKIPQFDAIIGGHTHTVLEKPLMAGGVMVVQAGSNLKYVGKMTLELENGKVVSKKDTLIAFTSLNHENIVVRNFINQYNNNQEFSKIVGYAEANLDGFDELGSLMTDALTHELRAEIAFQNKGGIRLQSLDSGKITLKDVYKLDPFNNEVMLYSMTADELKSLICYGYELMKGIDLQVSGITYSVKDDGAGHCVSVDMYYPSGKPLEDGKEFMVAMNNYMATTYQFKHKDPGTLSKMTTAEALIRYLGTAGKVNYKGIKRVEVQK